MKALLIIVGMIVILMSYRSTAYGAVNQDLIESSEVSQYK